MHIVSVYPLAKGVRAQQLDYYSPRSVSTGTLLTVPFGNRSVRAVAAESHSAQNSRATIRSADYELKPVTQIENQVFFSQFVQAADNFARFSATTTGATIRAMTPKPVIDNNDSVPGVNKDLLLPGVSAPPASILQTDRRQQVQYVNSLVQKCLENNKSAFLCCPTIASCRRWQEQLQSSSYTLHSGLTKKRILNRWQKAVAASKPIVVIATTPFLSLPRADLGRIIITDESDDAYKMNARPYLDKQRFARTLAQNYKRSCTLSDLVLSTETQWEYRNDSVVSEYKPVFNYSKSIDTNVIDMKDLSAENTTGVKIFAPPVVDKIRSVEQTGGQGLLYVARRGRRPYTICNDCGDVLTCSQCDLPMVLTENDQERVFVCRTCGKTETGDTRCHNCNSWRLEALGIGCDFVSKILQEHTSQAEIFQVDGSTHTSEEEISDTLSNFHNAEAGLLVTTTLGLNHLQTEVDFSTVVTADSLLTIPDLSVSHKLFRLLLIIRELTTDAFYIQTRSRQTKLFQQALAGSLTDFYDNQISQRKDFSYPPFTYLIKLSVSGQKNQAEKLRSVVQDKLQNYSPQIYPARAPNTHFHALIRIDRKDWVDDNLVSIIRDLPLGITVNAHPRSLL